MAVAGQLYFYFMFPEKLLSLSVSVTSTELTGLYAVSDTHFNTRQAVGTLNLCALHTVAI
jgi:hypothetical protein